VTDSSTTRPAETVIGAGTRPAETVMGAGTRPAETVMGAGTRPAETVMGAGTRPAETVMGAGTRPAETVMGAGTRPAVAVIGAGAAGLAAARALAGACAVTVFDKARGPGGRLAHRRREGFAFDFGAPFFTARDPRFLAELARLRAAGIVTPWACRFAEIEAAAITHRRDWGETPAHYVPVGRMSRLTAHWAAGLDVRQSCRIAALHRMPAGWALESEAGERFGPFAFVIVAVPAPQAAALLPAASPLHATAASARMQGAFSLMLGLAAPLDPGFDAALVRDGALSWISLCAARPGHEGGPGLVAISRNAWADAHLEDDPATIRAAMLDALAACLGQPSRRCISTCIAGATPTPRPWRRGPT
ncbi:unnamed protein product, partial [Acidocella sp. C78]